MRDLTVGKEWKIILLFALPMLLGNVFQQLYNMVDSVVVGNYLGNEALAAVGASFPIIFVLVSLIIGITIGTTVLISQYFGAKDFDSVKRAIDTMFVFLFFSSIIVTVVGILGSEYIFRMMKLPEKIIPSATKYLDIFLAGSILFFGYNGVSAALRGLGDSKTPLYFLIISTVLNIILCLFFVVTLHKGIGSVAIATVISQGVAFILAIIYLNKYHSLIKFSIKNIIFDKDIFYKSLKIGIPSGLQQTFVALGIMVLVRIVNNFGTESIAAYTVAGRIDMFVSMPAMNFSMALSAFVGQNIGAKKLERVRRGYVSTMLMSLLITVVLSVIIIIFGHTIMSYFTHDLKVIEIGESYLIIVSSFYVLFTAMFINNGVLRGAGDTLIPMFITLLSLWVLRIPISFILSKHYGTDGIWWGIPIAWFAGFLLSTLYYLTGRWKKKSLLKKTPPISE